jgi:hypothetical protein
LPSAPTIISQLTGLDIAQAVVPPNISSNYYTNNNSHLSYHRPGTWTTDFWKPLALSCTFWTWNRLHRPRSRQFTVFYPVSRRLYGPAEPTEGLTVISRGVSTSPSSSQPRVKGSAAQFTAYQRGCQRILSIHLRIENRSPNDSKLPSMEGEVSLLFRLFLCSSTSQRVLLTLLSPDVFLLVAPHIAPPYATLTYFPPPGYLLLHQCQACVHVTSLSHGLTPPCHIPHNHKLLWEANDRF